MTIQGTGNTTAKSTWTFGRYAHVYSKQIESPSEQNSVHTTDMRYFEINGSGFDSSCAEETNKADMTWNGFSCLPQDRGAWRRFVCAFCSRQGEEY